LKGKITPNQNVKVANSHMPKSVKFLRIRNTASYAAIRLIKERLSLEIFTRRLSPN
jgi:hypothetical protein